MTDNQKYYLTNFFQFLLIYAGAVIIFSFVGEDSFGPGYFDLKTGFMGVSLFAPFIIAHLIAKNMVKHGEP